MKKVFLFALIAVLFAACNKKDENMVPPEAEVSFSINESINNGLKSATVDDWVCPSDEQGNLLEPAYAEITIDGTLYTPDVYRLDGKLYTQSIKLDATVATHTVSKFLLYSADDKLIRATPETGSEYAEYVTQPVPFNINVNAFEKAEIPIEVLCFMPQNYTYFGFTWFASTEIAVREVCFFGDICLNGEPFAPADFNGSLYGSNVGVDVPAIMQIIVKRNGQVVPNSPFTNEGALNSPLCVQYPDILNVDGEVFTFELQLLLPDGNGFSYQTYYTYTATDDGALDIVAGDDGIVDFVVGTCGVDGVANQTFDFLFVPPVPPVVTAGYVSGGTKKASARWRNLRINGNGAEIYVGTNVSDALTRNELEFYGSGSQYFFAPAANSINVSYDPNTGILSTSTNVDGGVKNLDYNVGNQGTINYLQWQVNGDPGITLEFNNVQLTVGGQTYNLGSFETEYGDWYINYDLTSGFSLTGEMVINGQAAGDEAMKLEVSAKQF